MTVFYHNSQISKLNKEGYHYKFSVIFNLVITWASFSKALWSSKSMGKSPTSVRIKHMLKCSAKLRQHCCYKILHKFGFSLSFPAFFYCFPSSAPSLLCYCCQYSHRVRPFCLLFLFQLKLFRCYTSQLILHLVMLCLQVLIPFVPYWTFVSLLALSYVSYKYC